jgi:phage gp46-like protein
MEAWINPVTRDYELAVGVGSSLQRDPANGLANAAYLRLMTPLGSWFADPTLGSRLHELQREKDVSRVQRLAKQYAQDALKPLVQDGRAVSLEVETERQKDDSGAGRLALLVRLSDAQGSASVFKVYVKVV